MENFPSYMYLGGLRASLVGLVCFTRKTSHRNIRKAETPARPKRWKDGDLSQWAEERPSEPSWLHESQGMPDTRAVKPMAGTMGAVSSIDAVIIGNGPSAMMLSYILHGHIPFYNADKPHPDPLLHAKLKDGPQLLHLDVDSLTNHFQASRFPYSTQALPVNVLLDTLVRPNGDTDDAEGDTNILWRYLPEKAVSHVVFGEATQPGGQWTSCPAGTSWDIQSLSYAAMLSLPGYSFAEHHQCVTGNRLPPFTRPSRRAVAEYLAAYPAAVGINNVIHCAQTVQGISRIDDGFYIGSHHLKCRHLILASGVFSEAILPTPLLQALPGLPVTPSPLPDNAPLLVIGSGFSAADVIISTHKDLKIIHIFKWDPENRPSPLKSCHQQAYPEYAGIYRLMKQATLAHGTDSAAYKLPPGRKGGSVPFLESREWHQVYEGLPNAVITQVLTHRATTVSFRLSDGSTISREVSGLAYAVGRRGRLDYLETRLRSEIIGDDSVETDSNLISGQTLRAKATEDLEVAKDVFIIGSLTGDSLIRFAYGGCVYAAGKLMQPHLAEKCEKSFSTRCFPRARKKTTSEAADPVMNGLGRHRNTPHTPEDRDCPSDMKRDVHQCDISTRVVKYRRKGWLAFLLRYAS